MRHSIGYGGLVKVGVGKALEVWYEEGDNVKKSDTNKLSSSDRRVLLTHWVGEAVAKLDMDQLYRRRLFEKTGLAMTADGTDHNLINLEGLDGPYTFMNADDGREPWDDVLRRYSWVVELNIEWGVSVAFRYNR